MEFIALLDGFVADGVGLGCGWKRCLQFQCKIELRPRPILVLGTLNAKPSLQPFPHLKTGSFEAGREAQWGSTALERR